MKKLLVLMLCIIIVCALPTFAFAEGEDIGTVDTTAEVNEVTENLSVTEVVPETEPPDTELVPDPEAKTTADKIVDWIKENFEEITVVITILVYALYYGKKLIKSVGTLNNNAVSVSENSKSAITEALAGVSGISAVVSGFTEQMSSLLAEVRKNAEEKKTLEGLIAEVENYLKTAKLANVELSNEVAELLVLANIPNAKKEELYSRHRAAVDALASAEQTEVIVDDGQKA